MKHDSQPTRRTRNYKMRSAHDTFDKQRVNPPTSRLDEGKVRPPTSRLDKRAINPPTSHLDEGVISSPTLYFDKQNTHSQNNHSNRQKVRSFKGSFEDHQAHTSDAHANRSASHSWRPRPLSPEQKAHRYFIGKFRNRSVTVFVVLMVIFTLTGMLFFARPALSEVEKRTLTPFPEFTIEGFLDGSFFTGVSLWYSDTFPLREPLVAIDQAIKSHFGIRTQTQFVGGNVSADELPAIPAPGEKDTVDSSEADESKEPVQPPDQQVLAEEIQNQILNGVYIDDGAAYGIYYFSQESIERYAQAMNTAADRLADTSTVYSIIIPNNSGALLDEDVLASLGGSDQQQAIAYLYSLYNSDVHAIDAYETLREHRDEYIYFHTDHHWTVLGAYYVYLQFCTAKGIEPADVLSWEERVYEPFFGTYAATIKSSGLDIKTDEVDAYVPPSTNDMIYWDRNGAEIQANIITDVTGWNENSLYNTFIAGDQPLVRIDNPDRSDETSCLVVKESYGNCFVPLLVEDYETVWVIDFRYTDKNISDFAIENSIDDVIFINNISLAGTDPVSSALLAEVQ